MTGRRVGPPAGIDMLADLAHAAKVQRREQRMRRWSNGEAEVYKAKIARTKARKIREKRSLLPKKREQRTPIGLGIAERVLLAMLPGEWLTSVDIAKRSGLTRRQVGIKLRQTLRWNGMVISVLDPDRPAKVGRWGEGANPQQLHTLSLFGCAARASRVEFAKKIGWAQIIEPNPEWKIPGLFFDSFGIDFSPFFRTTPYPGIWDAYANARPAARAAWAQRAQAPAGEPPDGEPLPGALPDVLAAGVFEPPPRKGPRSPVSLPRAAVVALFPYRGGPYRKTAAGGASQAREEHNAKRPPGKGGRAIKSNQGRDPG